MQKLYLHVGLPKTATSTIQNFLAGNDQALAQQGWLYPKTARQYVAHHPLGNFFRPGQLDWIWNLDQAQVKADLLAEVKAAQCDNVIMSTEALASGCELEAIKDYFSDFEVYIVFFLRRQDKWLESAYQEGLKIGPAMGKAYYFQTHEHWLDLHKQLSNWASVFGADHLRVVVFEKGKEQQPVERQFLNAIDAPFSEDFSLPEIRNTSLSRDCLAFFMNMTTKRRIAPRFTLYADILRKFSEKYPDPPEWKNAWPPAERRALLDSYAASNEKVAREFCGIEDGILFQGEPPSDDDPWERYPGLTAARAVEIGEFLADNLLIRLNSG